MGELRYDPPSPEPARRGSGANQPQGSGRLEAARDVWSAMTLAWERQTSVALQWSCRLMAYRAAKAEGAPADLLGNWRWNLPIWSAAEREEFRYVMALAWHNMQKNNPELRTKEYRKYSPNTYATAEEWEREQLQPRPNGKEQPQNQ
jgi:hypothetical protein